MASSIHDNQNRVLALRYRATTIDYPEDKAAQTLLFCSFNSDETVIWQINDSLDIYLFVIQHASWLIL